MRAQRDSVTVGIHLRVVEVVVALRVVSQRRIVLVGRKHEGSATSPAAPSILLQAAPGPRRPARLAPAKNRGRPPRAAVAADTPCNWRFEIEFPAAPAYLEDRPHRDSQG